MSKEKTAKYIDNLHSELDYPWEEITEAIGKVMGVKLINTFRVCKACALGKAKKDGVGKKGCSKIKM